MAATTVKKAKEERAGRNEKGQWIESLAMHFAVAAASAVTTACYGRTHVKGKLTDTRACGDGHVRVAHSYRAKL